MSLVGHYERTLGASLERLYENVLDWEHLPHQHRADFASIALIEEGDWGWRAEVGLADRRTTVIELVLDRPAGRWVASTSAAGRRLSRIETQAEALGPDACRVAIDFHVFGLPASQGEAAGRYYESLYARLYDEDEAMMRARANAVRLGAAAHQARRPVTLADGRVVAVPLVCPHQALPLDAEPDRDGAITCPWHGYRFDAATGRNLDGKACSWRPG